MSDEAGLKAYKEHQRNAKRRGIPFLFSFEEWWAWWQINDHWSHRGVGKNKLVMARKGDTGPYSPENVYCTTHRGNQRDASPEARAEAVARSRKTREAKGKPLGQHLAVRGFDHPRSRQVRTPAGIFGSAALAAEHYGKGPKWGTRRAASGKDGWAYID